jgi:hypothetical protein
MAVLSLFIPAGCDRSDVITDKDPYFHRTVNIRENRVAEIAEASKRFGKTNGLAVSINEFDNKHISVLIYDKKINLTALNTVARDTFVINAYSRSEPTQRDIDLANRYYTLMVRYTS